MRRTGAEPFIFQIGAFEIPGRRGSRRSKRLSVRKAAAMSLARWVFAKDSMRPDSDVGVLVVVNKTQAEDNLVSGLSRVEKAIGRRLIINFTLKKILDRNGRTKNHS